jgi:hypothetical protein
VAVSKQRPKAYIKSIKFSDHTELHLARHEILVFVGPNNAGKSAALREIFSNIQTPNVRHVVVKSVIFATEGDESDAVEWVDSLPRRPQIAPNIVELPSGNVDRFSISSSLVKRSARSGISIPRFARCRFGFLGWPYPIFKSRAGHQPYSETPSAPLHHLYASDEQEMRLSRLFQQAFGEELAVNRAAGSTILLHMGKRPVSPAGKIGQAGNLGVGRNALEILREMPPDAPKWPELL